MNDPGFRRKVQVCAETFAHPIFVRLHKLAEVPASFGDNRLLSLHSVLEDDDNLLVHDSSLSLLGLRKDDGSFTNIELPLS